MEATLEGSVAEEWAAVAAHEGPAMDRIAAALASLRHRHTIDRSELAATLADDVAATVAEAQQASRTAADCAADVDHVRREIDALLGTAVQEGTFPPRDAADMGGALRDTVRRCEAAAEVSQAARDDAAMLRATVDADRRRAEEREAHAAGVDADIAARLEALERSNAHLRAELSGARRMHADSLACAAALVTASRSDAPTVYAAQDLRTYRDAVEESLDDLRGRVAAALGRVESMERFAKDEGDRRVLRVEELERAVARIEARPALPEYAPVVEAPADPRPLDTGLLPPPGAPAPEAALETTTLSTLAAAAAAVQSDFDKSRAAAASMAAVSAATTVASVTKAAPGSGRSFAGQSIRGDPSSAAVLQGVWEGAAPPPAPKPPLRERLRGFYQQHNPAKVGEIDAVLKEYAGAEAELFAALEVHYRAFGYFTAH